MLPDLPCKLDAAKHILKGRWGEDTKRGCYTLDGRPCNARDLLAAAAEPRAGLARDGIVDDQQTKGP